MSLNENSIKQWFQDRGDATLMLDHNLSKSSIVVDIGAYTGVWISQMISKYDCNYYALEPVNQFYKSLSKKFENSKNVHCINAGISNKNHKAEISVSGDGSSIFVDGEPQEITLYDFHTFLGMNDIVEVDLVQMNIEGMEYELMNHLLDTSAIKKIKKLLIQFHEIGSLNSVAERKAIQVKLESHGFVKMFDYPFVWEGWERIDEL
tara:strand:+ start:414 stop:1031 length:618 start_codon:yes stop_codon:yes gene_type:complete